MFNIAFELIEETLSELLIDLRELREHSLKQLSSVVRVLDQSLLHRLYSLHTVYWRIVVSVGVHWVQLVVAIVIDDVILLVILVIIGVERLTNYSYWLLSVILIIIIAVFVVNNVNRALDADVIIFLEMLSWHLTLSGLALVKEYERPVEVIRWVLARFLLLCYDRDVIVVVANAERQVVRRLLLDHRLRQHFVTRTLVLESSWNAKGPRVVELLELIRRFWMIPVRIHSYIINILIRTLFQLFGERRGCGYLLKWEILWRISSVWRLQFADRSHLLLFRFSKCVKTMSVIRFLRTNW